MTKILLGALHFIVVITATKNYQKKKKIVEKLAQSLNIRIKLGENLTVQKKTQFFKVR